MTLSESVEKVDGRWLASSMELSGGWASDLIWCGETLWIAWSTCEDPEPGMMAVHDKKWALKPDFTLDQWQETSRNIAFVISLGMVTTDGIVDTREISRSSSTTSGFSLFNVPGQSGPGIVWEEYEDGKSKILADLGNGHVKTISEASGAKLNLKAVCDSRGNLKIVWQQWNDVRKEKHFPPQVVFARTSAIDQAETTQEMILSAHGDSAWAPSISVDSRDNTWCAWDQWDGIQYHIFARYLPAAGEWGPAKQVSDMDKQNGYLNFGVDIVSDSEKAWVVWSRSTEWGVINHRLNHMRSLHSRILESDDLGSISIKRPLGKPVHGEYGVLPVPTIPFLYSQEPEFVNPQNVNINLDSSGNAVVFYRHFRRVFGSRDFGWALCATKNTGTDWSEPVRLTEHFGFPDSQYGVVQTRFDNSWVVATHSGESPAEDTAHDLVTNHKLILEKLSISPSQAADQLGVHEFLSSSAKAPASFTRPPKVALDPDSLRHESGRQQYDLLYGDLHRHTAYSKCMSSVDGDPLDQWRWAHDVEELDFYAITEHLEHQSYLEWRLVEDLTEKLSNNGKVITIHGFELVLPPGHTNFFYVDPDIEHALRVACLSARTSGLNAVWDRVQSSVPEEKILAIRHYHTFPGFRHEGDDLIDTYNPKYEQAVEIIQTRGDSSDWVRTLWQKGFRVGVVGSSDHSRNSPFPKAMTGLWLPAGNHDNESVLQGLKSKRTFATNGFKMSVFLSANSDDDPDSQVVVMGEQGDIKGKPKLMADVSGTRKLDTVQFFRDNTIIHTESLSEEKASIEFTDENPLPGEHIYWLRVTQLPETAPNKNPAWGVAYSSPIWIKNRA